MTAPFQFPHVGSTGVIQDAGIGTTIAQGIAGVLAAQQQQKENEFRMQQLAQQQQQQQALDAYYRGTIGVQNRELDYKNSVLTQEQAAHRQVGGAMQAALGMGQPGQQVAPQQGPTSTVGNMTQAQGPGEFKQILGGGAQAIGGPQGMQSIFGAVDPANMEAAAKGVEQVQGLAPKPEKAPELPASAKEMNYYTDLLKTDPAQAAQYKKMFLDKAPTTVINNIPQKGATKFSETLGEETAKGLMEGVKGARISAQGFPAMREAYGLVGKSFTGFGANQVMQVARFAGLAVKSSGDKVADTQQMVKLLREQTLAYLQTRALGSGTAVSDKDREFMERMSGADITLEPNAIRRIIRANVGATINKMTDTMNELRTQATAYPDNARQLNAEAAAIQKRLLPIWSDYAKMLNSEGGYVNDVAAQASRIPGVKLPGQP